MKGERGSLAAEILRHLERLGRRRQGGTLSVEEHDPALGVLGEHHGGEARAVDVEVRRRDHLVDVAAGVDQCARHLVVELALDLRRRREELGRHLVLARALTIAVEHPLVAVAKVVGQGGFDPAHEQDAAAEQRDPDDDHDGGGQAEANRSDDPSAKRAVGGGTVATSWGR